jgi:hypothetical protein
MDKPTEKTDDTQSLALSTYRAQGDDLRSQIMWNLEVAKTSENGETVTHFYSFETAEEALDGFVHMFHPWCSFRLTVKLNAGSSNVAHRWSFPLGYDYLKMAEKWRTPDGDGNFSHRKGVIDAALAQLLAVSR